VLKLKLGERIYEEISDVVFGGHRHEVDNACLLLLATVMQVLIE